MKLMPVLLFAAMLAVAGCRATTSTECVDESMPGPDCTIPATSTAKADDAKPAVIRDLAPTAGTAISFSDLTSSEVTVNWGAATDDVTTPEDLQYRVLRAANITEIKNPAKVTVAQDWTKALTTLKVSKLMAGNAYYFMVLVKDAVGNTAYYEPKAATPKVVKPGEPVDNAAPVPGTSVVFSDVTAHAMTVSWGAASDDKTAASKLRYQLKCLATGAAADSAVGIPAWTENVTTKALSDLPADTTYVCAVVVKDLAGNDALYSPASEATLKEAPPAEVPPVPVTAITVTSPNGGETFFRNAPSNMTWTTTNIGAEELVEIALSRDDGATWTILSNTQLAGSGLYAWFPNQLSTQALFRVTMVADSAVKDQSDATFQIQGGAFD